MIDYPSNTIDVPECPICLSCWTYLDLKREDDGRLTGAEFHCRECGYEWVDYDLSSKLLIHITEDDGR